MNRILVWIVNHPIACMAMVLVLVASAGVNLPKLTMDPGTEGLIIPGPDKEFYEATKETFGDDVLLAVVINCQNVFTHEILTTLSNLTDALEKLSVSIRGEEMNVVDSVMSLTTVNKISGEEDGLDVSFLIDEIPVDEGELERTRKSALQNVAVIGDLVSADGRTAAINARIKAAPAGYFQYDREITSKVETLIAEEKARLAQAGVTAEIFQVGSPLVKMKTAEYIAWNAKYCASVSILLIFTTLCVSFRSFLGVALPLATAGLSVVCVLGFMAYMGYAINAVSNIVPLLMIIIGSTEDVHILAAYRRQVRRIDIKIKAIQRMMIKSGLAITLTAVTTVFGFAALSVNQISLLRELGISAAVGLIANFILTLLVIPTLLRYMRIPAHFLRERSAKAGRKLKLMADFLHRTAFQRRRLVLGLVVLAVVVSLLGAARLRVDTDRISFFKKDTDIRKRLDFLHKRLSGGQSFLIVIDTGEGGSVKDHRVMGAIAEMQRRMNRIFDKTVSVADYVKMMNRAMHADDTAFFRVPDSDELIAQYLLMLEGEEMDRLLESDYRRACIAVRHNLIGSWRLEQELQKVRRWAETLFPRYVEIRMTGSSILANKASASMSVGAVKGLALAIVAILIVISILFSSLKAGFLAMIPNLVPITLAFGVMGWSGITLNPATAGVAVIALGIAVDDTIHLMVAFHKAMKGTTDQNAAMRSAIHNQLMPVLSTSTALALGFGVMIFSKLTTGVEFGYLASMTMVFAVLCDLLVTPALLGYTHLVTPWDFLRLKISDEFTQKSILFQGLKVREIKKVALLGVVASVSDKQPIVRQGEDTREMYLILQGEAVVYVHQGERRQEVRRLKRGDVFGEMSLITGEKRSADVVALGEMEVLKIQEESLDNVRARYPKIAAKLFYNLSAILSQRLRGAAGVLTGS